MRSLLLAFLLPCTALAADVPADFLTPKYEPYAGIGLEHHDFTSRGTRLHYVTAGKEGPWILFVHGFADYWHGWRDQLVALSAGHRVAALDLAGVNLSRQDRAPGGFTLAAVAEDLATLTRELGAKKVYVAGHDLGGWAAWQFAAQYPELCAGVITFAAPHPAGYVRELRRHPQPYLKRYADPAYARRATPAQLAAWVEERRDREEYELVFRRSSLPQMFRYYTENRALLKGRGLGAFSPIRVPALVVLGLRDQQNPPSSLDGISRHVPDSTVVTLPDVGHDPQRARSREMNRLLRDWIAAHEPKRHETSVTGLGRVRVTRLWGHAPDGYRMAPLTVKGTNGIAFFGGPLRWLDPATRQERLLSPPGMEELIDALPAPGGGVFALSAFHFDYARSAGVVSLLRPGREPAEPWRAEEIGREPTLHRIRWLRAPGGRELLVGAPLFGAGRPGFGEDQEPATLLAWERVGSRWEKSVIDRSLHAVHGLEVMPLGPGGTEALVATSREGITLLTPAEGGWKVRRLAEGDRSRANVFGSGEVALGRGADGAFLAAIEPWHGDKVALYPLGKDGSAGPRREIGRHSSGGHSIATLDVNGDGVDEVFGCFFGEEAGVYAYASPSWQPHRLTDFPFDCQHLLPFTLDGTNGLLAISDVAHEIVFLDFPR